MLFGLLSSGLSFSPAKDIPDLSGKVIFITGGNVGLGKETILQLSKHNPSHIYLSARSSAKAAVAIEDIKSTFTLPSSCPPITFIQTDLASLPSVVKAVQEFESVNKEGRLDRLFLNAGIMAGPAGVTEQGYELQFGTNHMGHALLTKLLLPTLLKTAAEPGADVRVVALSSVGHAATPWGGINFAGLKTPMSSMLPSATWTRYGQSKLANILFAKELARRNPSITAVAVHPGVVATELFRSTLPAALGGVMNWAKGTFFKRVEEGAQNQLWAGCGEGVVSGEYYMPVGIPGQCSRTANDAALAKKLWEWTEKELEAYTL